MNPSMGVDICRDKVVEKLKAEIIEKIDWVKNNGVECSREVTRLLFADDAALLAYNARY